MKKSLQAAAPNPLPWCAALAAVAALLAACGSVPGPTVETSPPRVSSSLAYPTEHSTAMSPSLAASAIASPLSLPGSCGATPLFAAPGPAASRIAGLDGLDWSVAEPETMGLAAYFFGERPHLVSGGGAVGKNKVLWVSSLEASGVLVITARPVTGTGAMVVESFPSAVSPPGNYPSGIDLPTPGCWHLDLVLGKTHAGLDVEVAPR